MKRERLKYAALGGAAGLLLAGLGWGFGNFYLVAAGILILAASLSWLAMPLPLLP